MLSLLQELYITKINNKKKKRDRLRRNNEMLAN